MDQIRSLSQMIEEARKLCASKGKKRVSVAMAEDAGLISAIEEARRTGLFGFGIKPFGPSKRAYLPSFGM